MGKIAVHPVLNRLPINFKNEIAINCFIGILKEFNYQDHKGIITIKKRDLWKMAKIKDDYREDVAKELIKELAHPQHIPYKVGENSYRITGSVFVFQEDEWENLKIEIPRSFEPLIFTKKDMDVIGKAKGKKAMTIEELDYWDSVAKNKKKEMFLLEQATVLGIKGKYAKRLYMLLKQFERTGYFVMGIEDFRAVMEIPEKYTLALINRNIIARAKTELTEKGIFQFFDAPVGKGRRKIEKIEMNFQSMENEFSEKGKIGNTKLEFIEEAEIIGKYEIKELLPEEEKEGIRLCVQSGDVSESFLKTMKKKNQSMYWNTLALALKNNEGDIYYKLTDFPSCSQEETDEIMMELKSLSEDDLKIVKSEKVKI